MTEQPDNLQLAQQRTDLAKERNSLANERTLLSWLRTGLGGMGGGVAIIRLLNFQSPTHKMLADWIGYFFILWGIAIFILAFADYKSRRDQLKLETGYAGSTLFIGFLIGTLIVASFILLFIVLNTI